MSVEESEEREEGEERQEGAEAEEESGREKAGREETGSRRGRAPESGAEEAGIEEAGAEKASRPEAAHDRRAPREGEAARHRRDGHAPLLQGEDRDHAEGLHPELRRFRDLVHAGRREAVSRHPRQSREGLRAHEQGELRRGRLGRHARPRARGHRPRGGAAGHGRQGDALQVSRRRRRLPDLRRYEGSRQAHRVREAAPAVVRRHQPRGYLAAEVLPRPRHAPQGMPHPRVARRPAGHGRGHRRRAHQRGQDRRQGSSRRSRSRWWARARRTSASPA